MRNITLFSLVLLLAATAQAQEKQHYMYGTIGGGSNSISYNLKNGNTKGGFGCSLNLGYILFFNETWGLSTGIGIQWYQATGTINYLDSSPSTDTDGDNYDFRTYYNNWKEKQKIVLLDVPVGALYHKQFKKIYGLLACLGFKMSVPVKPAYEAAGGDITTTGYYQQWNVELEDMPQHNFTTITSVPGSDFSAKMVFSLYADLGGTYKINKNLDLYAGPYFNYGLNNLINKSTKKVYQQDGIYNGILSSSQTQKAHVLSVGFKIGAILHLEK